MRLRAIALNTFSGLVRDRMIVILCALFGCIMLLMLSPLNSMRSLASDPTMESTVLGFVAVMMSLASGFGSLLAAWSSANAASSEMRSGTILAVMARPVPRWEYLLGRFLGVQMLMAVFVVFLFGFTYLTAAIGGQSIKAPFWALIAYPAVRYLLYGALGTMLGARLHPVLTFGIVVMLAMAAMFLSGRDLPGFFAVIVYTLLPVTNLLGEARFVGLTSATLKPIPWTDHATALAYGVDHAVVFFLLAVLFFRHRSLTRD
ncbi:MAG TPA: ABC transporter permease subunit [Bryobacteraceae bacterium]|nr:ABC transporter permease subunit [Bryobacteraceae bacterium]